MKKVISVPKDIHDQLQAILDIPEGHSTEHDRDGVIFTLTADFPGDIEADIKVCNGDTPYVDAVLFEGGCEVQVLEVSDTLEGEYPFELDGQEYLVEVVVK